VAGLEIRERLSEADPTSAAAIRDVGVARFKLYQLGEDDAEEHRQAAIRIMRAMDAAGQLSPRDQQALVHLAAASPEDDSSDPA
jgi:hypothetical protein